MEEHRNCHESEAAGTRLRGFIRGQTSETKLPVGRHGASRGWDAIFPRILANLMHNAVSQRNLSVNVEWTLGYMYTCSWGLPLSRYDCSDIGADSRIIED
jgi:hypothetical protein